MSFAGNHRVLAFKSAFKKANIMLAGHGNPVSYLFPGNVDCHMAGCKILWADSLYTLATPHCRLLSLIAVYQQ